LSFRIDVVTVANPLSFAKRFSSCSFINERDYALFNPPSTLRLMRISPRDEVICLFIRFIVIRFSFRQRIRDSLFLGQPLLSMCINPTQGAPPFPPKNFMSPIRHDMDSRDGRYIPPNIDIDYLP
jgi:hypothetical protein